MNNKLYIVEKDKNNKFTGTKSECARWWMQLDGGDFKILEEDRVIDTTDYGDEIVATTYRPYVKHHLNTPFVRCEYTCHAENLEDAEKEYLDIMWSVMQNLDSLTISKVA